MTTDPTKEIHRSESTLAKSAAQLRSKKFGLEFSVDPLFKKTCADFDEGNTHWLLMDQSLGAGTERRLRVAFGASDAVAKSGNDERADDVELVETLHFIEDPCDASSIRWPILLFLSSVSSQPRRPGQQVGHPSLRDFSFSANNMSQDDTFPHTQDKYDDDARITTWPDTNKKTREAECLSIVTTHRTSLAATMQIRTGTLEMVITEVMTISAGMVRVGLGGDTDQHVDSGMPGPGRTFVPLDSTRRPNEITTDR